MLCIHCTEHRRSKSTCAFVVRRLMFVSKSMVACNINRLYAREATVAAFCFYHGCSSDALLAEKESTCKRGLSLEFARRAAAKH